MRPRQPLALGLIVAAVHFGLSLAIVPLTLKIGTLLPATASGAPLYHVLAGITRVLYFPIVSLALYPRYWFPGQWMTVPIAVNSLLWGAALALIMTLGRRLRRRPVS